MKHVRKAKEILSLDTLLLGSLTSCCRYKLDINTKPRDGMSTGHRLLPSCDCKVRETMVANFELFL